MRTITDLNYYLPEIEISFQKSCKFDQQINALVSLTNCIKATHYFVEFAILWHETHDNIANPQEKDSWVISKCKEHQAIYDVSCSFMFGGKHV
jgi:hypothetical protein